MSGHPHGHAPAFATRTHITYTIQTENTAYSTYFFGAASGGQPTAHPLYSTVQYGVPVRLLYAIGIAIACITLYVPTPPCPKCPTSWKIYFLLRSSDILQNSHTPSMAVASPPAPRPRVQSTGTGTRTHRSGITFSLDLRYPTSRMAVTIAWMGARLLLQHQRIIRLCLWGRTATS